MTISSVSSTRDDSGRASTTRAVVGSPKPQLDLWAVVSPAAVAVLLGTTSALGCLSPRRFAHPPPRGISYVVGVVLVMWHVCVKYRSILAVAVFTCGDDKDVSDE